MSEKIRIGIDLRDLKKARTGTFTYLNEIVHAFRKMNHSKVEFIYLNYPLPVYSGSNFVLKITEHLLFFLWKQIVLPILCVVKKCDVLFCTDYFVPVFSFRIRKVAVFHDCFFFDHPEYYNSLWLRIFHSIGLAGAKKCSAIITPSVFVKERLGSLVPELRDKIEVVYEGITNFDHSISNEAGPSANENSIAEILKFSNGRKIALYVGTLDKRKNLDRLILAYTELKSTERSRLCLVIAGSSPSYKGSDHSTFLKELISKNHLGNDILMTGRVSQELLKGLYENAWFLIQPSLDEGFGLTIVEAMQFGLPFMAANNTAMPEVGGAAGIYFDPFNISEILENMSRLLNDDSLRKTLIHKGSELRPRYNWDIAAQKLVSLFISKS